MERSHNSLPTIIGWVSTCLLAGGASTVFSESSRAAWMIWGSFGLASALGLDITARVRDRMRNEALKLVANRRYERDMKYETDDKEANTAVREAVAHILGRSPATTQTAASRRAQKRHPCDLGVELLLNQDLKGDAGSDRKCTCLARVTNLSESGFELLLTEPLSQRRMEMIFTAANGSRQRMFGEVLWNGPLEKGSMVAGGRFLDAISVEGD